MTPTSVIAAAASFALVVLLVPLVVKMCARWKLYDWPGPLKIHRQPVPRLGGIAVTLAILGGILLSTCFSSLVELLVFAAIVLICTVGAIDDVHGLSATVRLTAQVAAGALLWLGCGKSTVLGSAALGLVGSCLFTVAIVNSLNFLDGADGIASGVAGIIAVGYGVLTWPAYDRPAVALAWAVAGSCAGFLPFNLGAKIFLGDCGSTVLGLCVALLGLRFYHSSLSSGPRLLFPLIVAGLPLLDMTLAVLRRIRARASPCLGDRRHVSDLLAARGMSGRTVALVCYGVTILFVLIGSVAWTGKPALFFVLASVSVGTLLAAAIRMGALRLEATGPQQTEHGFAEAHPSHEIS